MTAATATKPGRLSVLLVYDCVHPDASGGFTLRNADANSQIREVQRRAR